MENLTPEMIEMAKAAKSAEELRALAKENGLELNEEEANAYFKQLSTKSGELDDDDLDNVAGGCSDANGNMIVTVASSPCAGNSFVCKCGGTIKWYEKRVLGEYFTVKECDKCGAKPICGNCRYCVYEQGLWKCMH